MPWSYVFCFVGVSPEVVADKKCTPKNSKQAEDQKWTQFRPNLTDQDECTSSSRILRWFCHKTSTALKNNGRSSFGRKGVSPCASYLTKMEKMTKFAKKGSKQGVCMSYRICFLTVLELGPCSQTQTEWNSKYWFQITFLRKNHTRVWVSGWFGQKRLMGHSERRKW